jgi:hypothetical protein
MKVQTSRGLFMRPNPEAQARYFRELNDVAELTNTIIGQSIMKRLERYFARLGAHP